MIAAFWIHSPKHSWKWKTPFSLPRGGCSASSCLQIQLSEAPPASPCTYEQMVVRMRHSWDQRLKVLEGDGTGGGNSKRQLLEGAIVLDVIYRYQSYLYGANGVFDTRSILCFGVQCSLSHPSDRSTRRRTRNLRFFQGP